jgi:hypothetical protein
MIVPVTTVLRAVVASAPHAMIVPVMIVADVIAMAATAIATVVTARTASRATPT